MRVSIEIRRSDRLFVLTGAGISAESGIPTFRGQDGLWEGHRLEDVATLQAFTRDPELVWRFYSMRRSVAAGCNPNPGHIALAKLEEKLGERMFVCTQNVDNLHEQAGSTRVCHMHGHLFRSRCSDWSCPTQPFEDKRIYEKKSDIAKCIKCGALIRPDICWFGETPFHIEAVLDALRQCTVFLTVGSSGVVEPAASFVQLARQKGARAYYLGLEEPANAVAFHQVFLGKSGERLPELFQPDFRI
jgi:NAD-dependent protein deacetylase/lipoamidase